MSKSNLALPVGGVVLVALFGFALWSYLHDRREERAALAMGEVLAVVERPVGAATPAEDDGSDAAPFPTERAKDEGIVKSLSDFRAKEGFSRATRIAELPLAQAELRLGRVDTALPTLTEFAKREPTDNPLRVLALEGEGYAHEAKGEYAEAQAAFEKMNSENKTEFMNGMGLYHRARMLLLQGKKVEAAAAFSEIGALAPGTAAARLAAERVSELAQQGVVAPPSMVPSVAAAADAGI
jgi:tetratricopeptide (TPR) repeat protein